MDQDTTQQRRLIAAMDNYSLLGLSKLGHGDERRMAQAELEARDIPTPSSVMDASRRLVDACDRLDALIADTPPPAAVVLAAVGDPIDLLETGLGRMTEPENIQDAEVVGQEIVHYTEPPTALFKTDDPVEVIEKATAVANALKAVLVSQKLVQNIQGKDHVKVEGWTTLAAMLGVTAVCVATEPVDGGYRATVEARMPDGRVVGRADALCTKYEKRGPWKTAEDYARLSMAQTRATSKALKGPLGFVVALAGYATTPAEEMAGAVGPVEPESNGTEPEGEPMTAAQRKGVIKAIEKSDNPVDLVLRAVGVDSPDDLMTHHWPQIEALIGVPA